ncbi:MAG: type I-A CRISPR-associated protein Cas4/Csa1 [Firmicutes bacterium]|nr:type I-A CRISPR-associated protein Cas4/Csa1 [Bacillota bacterium]
MYFLSDEENKQLLRSYLPRSREERVDEELRGWNWPQPPLAPAYDLRLPLSDVANSYCPSGRDIYLKKVEGRKASPNEAMIRGKIFHEALVHVIVSAKRLIYGLGVANYQQILLDLAGMQPFNIDTYKKGLPEEEFSDIQRKVEIITRFETARIASRLQEVLIRQPYVGEDSLVAIAIPVVVEQKLDGTFLGLSPNLSTDAYTFAEPMVLDLKFGEPKKFHRLATTGYGLVIEALHEFPVNLGCIVYAEFKGDRLLVKKDLHIISDELRQWFVEQRDERMRMLYEEIDPGLAEECYSFCPYYQTCHNA